MQSTKTNQRTMKTYAKKKKPVTRTRRKTQTGRASLAPIVSVAAPHLNASIFDSDHSLRDDFWMDEFDHLLQGKTPLREQNILRKDVRANYNLNSSVEGSPMPLSSLIVSRIGGSESVCGSPSYFPPKGPIVNCYKAPTTLRRKGNSIDYSEGVQIRSKGTISQPANFSSAERSSSIHSLAREDNISRPGKEKPYRSRSKHVTESKNRGRSKRADRENSSDRIIKPIYFKRRTKGSFLSLDSSSEISSPSCNERDQSTCNRSETEITASRREVHLNELEGSRNVTTQSFPSNSDARDEEHQSVIPESVLGFPLGLELPERNENSEEYRTKPSEIFPNKAVLNGSLNVSKNGGKDDELDSNTNIIVPPSQQLLEFIEADNRSVNSAVDRTDDFVSLADKSIERKTVPDLNSHDLADIDAASNSVQHKKIRKSTLQARQKLTSADKLHTNQTVESIDDSQLLVKAKTKHKGSRKRKNKLTTSGSNMIKKMNQKVINEFENDTEQHSGCLWSENESSDEYRTQQADLGGALGVWENEETDIEVLASNTNIIVPNLAASTHRLQDNLPFETVKRNRGRPRKTKNKLTTDDSLKNNVILDSDSIKNLKDKTCSQSITTKQLTQSGSRRYKVAKPSKKIITLNTTMISSPKYFLRSKSGDLRSKKTRTVETDLSSKLKKKNDRGKQKKRKSVVQFVSSLRPVYHENLEENPPDQQNLVINAIASTSNKSTHFHSDNNENNSIPSQSFEKNDELLIGSLQAIGMLKKLRRVKVKLKRLRTNTDDIPHSLLNASRLSVLADHRKKTRQSVAKFGQSVKFRRKQSRGKLDENLKKQLKVTDNKTVTISPVESDYEDVSETVTDDVSSVPGHSNEYNVSHTEEDIRTEYLDSDDSSVDSLIFSFLRENESIRKSSQHDETLATEFNLNNSSSAEETTDQSVSRRISLPENLHVIRKRKSRLAENIANVSPEKVQILHVSNAPRIFKKTKVKLKRLQCSCETCKHLVSPQPNSVEHSLSEYNSAGSINIAQLTEPVNDDSSGVELLDNLNASKDQIVGKSGKSHKSTSLWEQSAITGFASGENNLIESGSQRSSTVDTLTSHINISSRNNTNTTNPTPDQSQMKSLQPTLDDSIDRDAFINNITRNATLFMNKSNMLNKSHQVSANEASSKTNSWNCSYIARRSSLLAGPEIPSLRATIYESDADEIDMEVIYSIDGPVLHSGKWRQALNAWRKTNSAIVDKTVGTPSGNNSTASNTNHSTSQSRRQQPKNYQNSPAANTSYMLLSSRGASAKADNAQCSSAERKGLVNRSLKQSNVKNKNVAFTFKRPEPIIECSFVEKPSRKSGERDNANVLLLEPTDDGTPNLPSISLLESAIERNLQITSRSSQKGVESAKTASQNGGAVDQSNPRRIFNETDSNEISIRQLYQHQLSVPLYRQPSIPRRRRSSFAEHCDEHSIIPISIPTSGTRQLHLSGAGDGSSDVLDFPSFVHIPYERRVLSTSLNARDRVLRRCNQSEPLEFSIVYSENVLRHCRKIGEGVYGEVFMNKTIHGEAIVLKIIPIEGSIEVNGEPQKTFEQILSEIVIAMELSRLREDGQFMTGGFVDVKKICCVQGRYPDHLIDLWELYRDNCGTENDHPEIFSDDQLYIVLELANGGQDLEAFTFQNALQSYSAFAQTALTLAVAEQKFQFEHRDLHWGNILLAATDDPAIIFRLNGKEIKVPSHGVKVTIIDYTLSRMVYNGCCLYNDLSNDSELFLATGDYQFDVYRFMKQHLKNQWTSFEPYTNILWLHYTIDKMISGARYRCSKSKKHRSAIQDMMRLRDELLDFKSASDYVECLK